MHLPKFKSSRSRIALALVVVSLSACVDDEKYAALMKERDALKAEITKLNDTSKIQAIRSDGLAMIRGIAGDAFDPVADSPKLKMILAPENEKQRVAAFQDQTSTVQKILAAYEKAADKEIHQFIVVQAKVKDLEEQIEKVRKDSESAKDKVDADGFIQKSFGIERKFDVDSYGNSLYEATPTMSGKKVVVVAPKGMTLSQGHVVKTFAKDLGEQPFQLTVSNAFRSYEQKEFAEVYQLATAEQALALQGSEVTLQQLNQQLSNVKGQLDAARFHLKMQVSIAMNPLMSDVQRIVGAAGCSKASDTTASSPSNPAAAPGNGPLYQQCMDEMKAYVIAQVGQLKAGNEEALGATCRTKPKEALCFTQKAKKEDGGLVSLAAKGQLERECGF